MSRVLIGGGLRGRGRRAIWLVALAATLLATGCGLIPNDPDPGNRRFNRVKDDPAITTQPPGTEALTAIASPRSEGYDPLFCPPFETTCPPAQDFVVRRFYRITPDTADNNEAIFAWYDGFLTEQGFVRNKAGEERTANLPRGGVPYKTDSHNCIAIYRRGEITATPEVETTGMSIISRSTIYRSSAPKIDALPYCTLTGTSFEPDGTLQVGIGGH